MYAIGIGKIDDSRLRVARHSGRRENLRRVAIYPCSLRRYCSKIQYDVRIVEPSLR